jgi:hypothetical protein
MIFAPESVDLILNGKKTQTRRPVDMMHHAFMHESGDQSIVYNVWSEKDMPRTIWAVGKDYAVCPGRGKHQVARFVLDAIRRERLCDITDADAIAEGVVRREDGLYEARIRGITTVDERPSEAFKEGWKNLYPKSDLTELVWALHFHLVL